jgi:hypothetical protein
MRRRLSCTRQSSPSLSEGKSSTISSTDPLNCPHRARCFIRPRKSKTLAASSCNFATASSGNYTFFSAVYSRMGLASLTYPIDILSLLFISPAPALPLAHLSARLPSFILYLAVRYSVDLNLLQPPSSSSRLLHHLPPIPIIFLSSLSHIHNYISGHVFSISTSACQALIIGASEMRAFPLFLVQVIN